MSDGAWTLLVLVIGATLAPAVNAVGYVVRRRLDRSDRMAEGRRKALYDLQDAVLELAGLRDARGEYTEDRANARRLAVRRVRIEAARVEDAEIWQLVHPPVPATPTFVAKPQSSGTFPPSDDLDAINRRIRDLLMAL